MSKTATKVQWNPDKDIDRSGITNVSRAEQADECISLYAIAKGERATEVEMTDYATDLIADILHYLASQNVEPETALETALMHFEAER